MLSHLPILQVVVPMLMAPLVLLIQPARLAWALTLATSALAFAIAINLVQLTTSDGSMLYPIGGWEAPYGIELQVDGLSALFLLIVSGASTFVLLAGYQSLISEIKESKLNWFFGAWLLALAGLLGIVVSGDAFNIFVFMEIASLASYVLIAGGPNRQALPAVFKYLIMGTIGATFYLIGIGLIYIMTGTLNMSDIATKLPSVVDQTPILVAAGFISIGLALKAAIFPMHAWLPNTYCFAPNMVTAFLAACSTKIAIYVLLRVDFTLFQSNLIGHLIQFKIFLIPLACMAILAGAYMAMRDTLAKKIFAWSSVGQVGYIILGAALVSHSGLTSALLHSFNHALAKGTIFIGIGLLALQAKSGELSSFAGLGRRHPLAAIAITIAGLSLVGIPGTAGFLSKWLLIQAVFEQPNGVIALLAIVLVSSLMSVVYLARFLETLFFPPAPAGSEPTLPLGATAILVMLALSSIYFGLAPALPMELATQAADTLLGYGK
jgi:multicomponent Na+:H+ antiporter subunit D